MLVEPIKMQTADRIFVIVILRAKIEGSDHSPP
jgi:hypothetical protein